MLAICFRRLQKRYANPLTGAFFNLLFINHYFKYYLRPKSFYIGKREKIEAKGKIVDLNFKLVLPGLINTHTHSHTSLFKNTADDLKLMDWLQKAMWPLERHLNENNVHLATALSCIEFIRSGVTTIADMCYFANSVARATMDCGLRSFIGSAVFSGGNAETKDTLGVAIDFLEKYSGKEDKTLIYPCLGPHAPYTVNKEYWLEIVKLSEKHDTLIMTHISETKEENNQIKSVTGMSPVRWLESLGTLSRPVLAAHCVHLEDQDIEILRKNNVAVSYNPVSNLKLVSGIMPYRRLSDKGVKITLGTDGAQSNNSLDLLQDLKTGVLIQKMQEDDPTFLPSSEALKIVTSSAASSLGMAYQIGSLEVGKKADLITLDSKSPRMTPNHISPASSLYSSIVYSACSADVEDSMVNGKWLMRDRNLLTIDEGIILKEAQKASETIIKDSKIFSKEIAL